MKYPTMRFVFDRKKVATKTHKGLVQIEVLSEGKRKWIGTGVKVYSDQWNDRKKIINSVEMIQLNQCLDEQLRIIQNWIFQLPNTIVTATIIIPFKYFCLINTFLRLHSQHKLCAKLGYINQDNSHKMDKE